MKTNVYYPSKIYLSGQITGLQKHEYERNFRLAKWKLQLKHGCKNIQVINPLDIKPLFWIKTWFFFMITDLIELYKCDTIYMLNNWEKSKGAKIEHLFAIKLKKRIIYQ